MKKNIFIFILLSGLILMCNCNMLSIVKEKLPAPTKVGDTILFRIDYASATTVNIAGDWNEWCGSSSANGRFDVKIDALKDDDGDGIWEIKLKLKPGKHIYKFVIDQNNWIKDPTNRDEDNDGNSYVIVE